eukprot:CAMPEP_0194205432 /NCGR_PEP_ID=MMETSP0156-20130528/4700_1 /TAXON_ID=33649 /ORGANISM="Thalassionema nitzschioides, Strain L26-B" /LENGTH=456 /DNA_ID=CAMNT_0038931697 /DNA_START=8 /DNA_END=1378 /DNA_ORIENTATION=-
MTATTTTSPPRPPAGHKSTTGGSSSLSSNKKNLKFWAILLPYFLITYLFFYIHVIQRASIRGEIQQDLHHHYRQHDLLKNTGGKKESLALQKSLKALEEDYQKETEELQKSIQLLQEQQQLQLQQQQQRKQEIHTTNQDDEIITALQNQISVLQHKLDAYLGWGQDGDPFYSSKVHTPCHKFHAAQGSGHAYGLCLDDFPYLNCVVYEFGIREQVEFGMELTEEPYGCEVHAFDPSPITKAWYNGPSPTAMKLQRKPGKWKLYDYGGGFADETITLREYNWGQVSIYHYPESVINPQNCTVSGHCRYHKHKAQKVHQLPVRSVDSIMKELGHDRVAVLKLDVEGSEYRMLENLIDSGACLKIDQILLEWHHYDFDLRYGLSSIPIHNVFHSMLKEKCGLEQFWIHDPTGWPSNEKLYAEMGLTLRYNIASFKRPSSAAAKEAANKPPVFFTKNHGT